MAHTLQGLCAWDLLVCGPSLTFTEQQCQNPLSWVTDQKYINRMNQCSGVKKGTNVPNANSHVWPEDKLPVLQACYSLKMGLDGRRRALLGVQKLARLCVIYRSMYIDAHKHIIHLHASKPPQPNCFLSLEVSHLNHSGFPCMVCFYL